MKKTIIPRVSALLLAIIISSFFVSAAIVDSANGTITVNNNNGNIDATMTNTLTVIFSEPAQETTSSGGGGGGSGLFDKYNYSKPAPQYVDTATLEELLETIQASEIGLSSLNITKMRAELINTLLTTSKLDADGVSQWIAFIKSSATKDYIDSIISNLRSGEYSALGAEHKSEVFLVKSIYANQGSTVTRTKVTIKFTADKALTNVRVIELIPKSIAASDAYLVFPSSSQKPRVVEKDPVLEWSIPSIKQGETKIFTYYVKGDVVTDDFRTVIVYSTPKPVQPPTGEVINPPQPEPEPQITGEEGEQPKAKPFKISWIIPLIVVGVLAGIGVGVILQKKNADARKTLALSESIGPKDLKIRPDLIIPYDKVRGIEQFIEKSIRQGKHDVEIKNSLIVKGWNEHVVDVVMHDVHTVDKNIDKLDNFIKVCVDKGMPMSEIRTTLINVGWREDVVDLALDDFM